VQIGTGSGGVGKMSEMVRRSGWRLQAADNVAEGDAEASRDESHKWPWRHKIAERRRGGRPGKKLTSSLEKCEVPPNQILRMGSPCCWGRRMTGLSRTASLLT